MIFFVFKKHHPTLANGNFLLNIRESKNKEKT